MLCISGGTGAGGGCCCIGLGHSCLKGSGGRTAADGDGLHSPYTEVLLSWIGKPGREINEVFRRVREEVVRETNGQQIPWENSSLIGDGIYLVGDEH